jgi:hypothetical protein
MAREYNGLAGSDDPRGLALSTLSNLVEHLDDAKAIDAGVAGIYVDRFVDPLTAEIESGHIAPGLSQSITQVRLEDVFLRVPRSSLDMQETLGAQTVGISGHAKRKHMGDLLYRSPAQLVGLVSADAKRRFQQSAQHPELYLPFTLRNHLYKDRQRLAHYLRRRTGLKSDEIDHYRLSDVVPRMLAQQAFTGTSSVSQGYFSRFPDDSGRSSLRAQYKNGVVDIGGDLSSYESDLNYPDGVHIVKVIA